MNDPFEQIRSSSHTQPPDKPAIWDKTKASVAAGARPNDRPPGRWAKVAGAVVGVLVLGVAVPLTIKTVTQPAEPLGGGSAGQPVAAVSPTTPATTPAPESVQLVIGTVPKDAGAQVAALAEPLFPLVVAAADSATNPAYSPLSVYLTLGLVANGASGQAAEQLDALLGGPVDVVNKLAAGVMTEYVNTNAGPKLVVANSLWLADWVTVNPAFANQAQAIFRAEVTSLDLVNQGKEQINQWVAQKTNQLIDEIVGDLQPDTIACLVNALYFKAAWQLPFSLKDTENRPFTLADGTVVEVPTMYGHHWVEAFSTDTADGVVLPYAGERFGMVVALPAEGVDQISWDGSQIASWLAAADTEHGVINVYMPKWESQLSADLVEPLEQLGLTEPFDPATYDLAGITEPGGFISEVAHKAVVKVDERGTEASAATNANMLLSMGSDIRFDRPFVYAIVDLETGLPLFLGQVNNPLAIP